MVETINEMEKTFFAQQLTIAETKTNEAKAKFDKLGETWNKILQATLLNLDATLKSFQFQVVAWGDAKEKMVIEQEVYNYGTIIMQTFRDPESLRKVPKQRIAIIAGVVYAWIEMNMHDLKVKPSMEINKIEENLLYYREFSLKALAKLLFDALSPQLI